MTLGSPGWYAKEFLPMTVKQTLSVVALILAVLALVPIGPYPFLAHCGATFGPGQRHKPLIHAL